MSVLCFLWLGKRRKWECVLLFVEVAEKNTGNINKLMKMVTSGIVDLSGHHLAISCAILTVPSPESSDTGKCHSVHRTAPSIPPRPLQPPTQTGHSVEAVKPFPNRKWGNEVDGTESRPFYVFLSCFSLHDSDVLPVQKLILKIRKMQVFRIAVFVPSPYNFESEWMVGISGILWHFPQCGIWLPPTWSGWSG